MAAPLPLKTSFTYDSFTLSTVGLTYQGKPHIPPGTTVLRLTETDSSGLPIPKSVSRVLYSQPIKFSESSPARLASFDTTIKFKVTPSSNNGAADGLAFFIAPINSTIPSESFGGHLGIFGPEGRTDNLFAVEFDTFINDRWDPKDRHIGIDVENRKSVITEKFDCGTGESVTAHINFNSQTSTITVTATSGQNEIKPPLSRYVDLANVLTPQVQVGISSASGNTVSELGLHDVISWSFCSYFD